MLFLPYIYSFLLYLASPFYIYSLYKKKPGKPPFGKRWKEHFGLTPTLEGKQRPIWVHAVSVGEVIAVIPLLKKIKQQHPDKTILVTTTTSTGAQQLAELKDSVQHRYMPLDFNFAIKLFLKTINPQQLIIMETELWPNTLRLTAQKNIPISVINARLSERSCNRYLKVQGFFNLISNAVDQFLCQNEADRLRFLRLGIATEKVAITGSIKFDISINENTLQRGQALRKLLGKDRPIWIAASTHQDEDQQLLDAHIQILKQHNNALLILVPRHPERFNEVFRLCKENMLSTAKRSDNEAQLADKQVYLGDSMGEMLTLISAADICFMAGSLIGDKVGGHNLLEPAALGKAILTGPSYYNFLEITKQLVENKACIICENSKNITKQLSELFTYPQQRITMGKNALNTVEKNKGAIQKTLDKLNIKS
jgi:3-deoxy-D-manno-octulosonic-acid transferase